MARAVTTEQINKAKEEYVKLPDPKGRNGNHMYISPGLRDLLREHRIVIPTIWWREFLHRDGTSRWYVQKLARIRDRDWERMRDAAMETATLRFGWCSQTALGIYSPQFRCWTDYGQLVSDDPHDKSKYGVAPHVASKYFMTPTEKHPQGKDYEYVLYPMTYENARLEAREVEEDYLERFGTPGHMTFEDVRTWHPGTGTAKILTPTEFDEFRTWVRDVRKLVGDLK